MPLILIKFGGFVFVLVCGYVMARLLVDNSPFYALLVGGFMCGVLSWLDRKTYKRAPCECDREE